MNMISYKAVKQIYNDMFRISNENLGKRNIFHYTNTEVLNIILSNATLRASHVLYLNDAEEYYKGMDVIKKTIDSDVDFEDFNDMQGIFSISFSKSNDLLSQWITYAKESGVSIEFDDRLLSLRDEEGMPRFVFGIEDDSSKEDKIYTNLVFDTSKVLHEIIYVSEYEEKIRDKIKESYKKTCETDISGMPLYATYIKDQSFEAEKEIRAAFIYHQLIESLDKNAKKYCPKLNYYRTDKGILRPFINVQFLYFTEKDRNDSGEYTSMLPLKSITIGPSGNQQAVFDSVVHRIKYGEIAVYDYSDDDELFKTNFDSYLNDIHNWMAMKGHFNVSLNTALVKESDIWDAIKEQLIHQWKNNFPDKGYLIDKTDSDDLVSDSEDIKYIVKEINKHFYFSKEGIIIKKSKIPYIF